MKRRLVNFTSVLLVIGAFLSAGCGPSNEPTGPAKGSVQEYLDANPDIAARVDEDIDTSEDDGTGE